MQIRHAEKHDVTGLVQLVEQYWAFEEVPDFAAEKVADALTQMIESPTLANVWVAESNDSEPKLIGYLMLVYVFSLEHTGLTAEIDEFYVEPEHRGGGVGGLLLAAVESECRRRRCSNLSLQLGTSNNRARDFYRRHGFLQRRGFELLEKQLSEA